MKKEELYYKSFDELTKIHANIYIPSIKAKAVLIIIHGMCEHIERYEQFALYMNSMGIIVAGHDHLGHGLSVKSKDRLGYFVQNNANECLIQDINKLREIIEKRYKELPLFMLGHSMGSFLLRQYISGFSKGLKGVIIMGTGYYPIIATATGQFMCWLIAIFKGWFFRSRFIKKMVMGSYNKRLQPVRTEVDWLSKDERITDEYINDPLSGFTFTLNAYFYMFEGMKKLMKKKAFRDINKSLPVLFASGEEDPVGNYSKGVKKVYKAYVNNMTVKPELKLYKDDRHEILNETNRLKVYSDIYEWINDKY